MPTQADFNVIKTAVAKQFALMAPHQLFRVDVDRDVLWSTYLLSFPPGSNPVYRERTEHDCSCCRQFIKGIGDVVAVINGEVVSLWDVEIPSEPAYQAVVRAMSRLVKSKPIKDIFLHPEPVAGVDKNFEKITDAVHDPGEAVVETVKKWTHFYVNIPPRYIKSKLAIPAHLSNARSSHDVFLRSLREITPDSLDTVLELIAQGSLYRGEEHRALVLQFQALKRQYDKITADLGEYPFSPERVAAKVREQDIFAWTADASGAACRFRNTVIGTLCSDLSEGRDLDTAVRSFESKVAPTNYKRPSALITKKMVEQAKEKIAELGLTSALGRRFAVLSDITINNVLHASRKTRRTLTHENALDELADTVSNSANVKNLDKVEEVPIDKFISDILPRAESLEVMFENRHQGNLVSLIAPTDPTSGQIFKWPNLFSWSYTGEVTDAIKERVKAAGGDVTGDLCCRLAWGNYDDLDLHMSEGCRPSGAHDYEIYFGNRHETSPSGGRLDVDMNISPQTREPVENIFYAKRTTMREGEYHLFVHQYNARETSNPGFEVEIDYLGTVHRFVYAKPVRHDEEITVARFKYTHKGGMEIIESLPSTQATRMVWGIPTQAFHPVSALMLSPNHWDGGTIGNRHYFFMLDGCTNDGSARGFFNEFLDERLTPHRKVFEVLAGKMKPEQPSNPMGQLSGLGFSSTRRDSVVCKVKGSFSRIIRITF